MREKIKKYIKNDNLTWTREVLLKLIYIKKGNIVRYKSIIGNNDRECFISICIQRNNAKIIITSRSL